MSIMWIWWIAQLVFIFLVEIFRYIAIGLILLSFKGLTDNRLSIRGSWSIQTLIIFPL